MDIPGIPGLWDVDGVGVLCDNCSEMSEPPWRPNNRDRCAYHLTLCLPHALRGDEVLLKAVADFIADNVP